MYFCFILDHSLPLSKIILQCTDHNNQEYRIKTPLRIAPDGWDAAKQRPVNIYLKTGKKLHAQLGRIRIAVAQYFKAIGTKGKWSVKALTQRIRKCCQVKTDAFLPDSLLYHMDRYITSRLHLITGATHKRYRVFLKLVERFEGYSMENISIDKAGACFVKDFLAFGIQEQYSTSTIYRTVHFVKTVLHYLEKRGIRTFVYELELPKQSPQQKNVVTLTSQELSAVKATEVPDELKAAKDWLLISCYTGQRVSDFMTFTHHMLQHTDGKKYLSFVQQKTKKHVLLPLHPVVAALLEKNGGCFPQKIPLQKYNRQIRQVVEHAGIDTPVTAAKRLGFRSLLSVLPKWEAITSHTGRRSFATNFYGSIPTALLMEATGHSTEQLFQRYIGNADTVRAERLGSYFEALYRA